MKWTAESLNSCRYLNSVAWNWVTTFTIAGQCVAAGYYVHYTLCGAHVVGAFCPIVRQDPGYKQKHAENSNNKIKKKKRRNKQHTHSVHLRSAYFAAFESNLRKRTGSVIKFMVMQWIKPNCRCSAVALCFFGKSNFFFFFD